MWVIVCLPGSQRIVLAHSQSKHASRTFTAAHMPRDLDFAAAAAVPLAALTALQALRDELGVKPGQKVFISGGAGGVGTFAIQIAKRLGAHVTTTASQRGEALVRSLGCDEVIDYTSQDISKTEARFDAGFDLIGGNTLEQMFKIMKPELRSSQ